MTLPDFLDALRAALAGVEGVGLVHGGSCWPEHPGGRLRLVLPNGSWAGGPIVVDPIGLVYLHKTGKPAGLLFSYQAAQLLGFTTEQALAVIAACDAPEPGDLWRLALTTVLGAWELQLRQPLG